ncbi:MAG TPA: hypothetical protein VFL92_08885 [Sphingomonas sp.]|nr:hypothetical protein [Sphingomonas sp.]
MRLLPIAAALLLAGSIPAAPAVASGQPGWHHDNGRHGDWRRHRRWRHNRWEYWRNGRWGYRHRVCGWRWHHHHRVRRCWWTWR